MDKRTLTLIALAALIMASCRSSSEKQREKTMVIIDPGHFHASLIEKRLLPGVSDTVKVYAPEGQELDAYLEMVESFNERNDEPTSWYQDVHSGKDFLSQVPLAKKGDFVVLAGNNKRKTEYIFDAVSKGYNVLSDKPMAITPKGYSLLKEAYSQARKKKLILLDIMTERYDTLNALARKMISFDKVIGDTIESVSMVSVHHFYKKVTGSVLTRPAWYYDVKQQGIGIADVSTHLIDLVFWQCFPNVAIEESDVTMRNVQTWPTPISLEQYTTSTGERGFPEYLHDAVEDGVLEVLANGRLDFEVNGVPISIEIKWNYEAPPSSGDTFEAVYKGNKGSLEIVQDFSTDFVKQMFLTDKDGKRMLNVPVQSRESHEDHFNRVARRFIDFIDGTPVPEWEGVNTLTKYYITTSAEGDTSSSHSVNSFIQY